MLDGYTDGIEKHEDYDEPVEPLRLYGVPYPEPESLLVSPEFSTGALVFHF